MPVYGHVAPVCKARCAHLGPSVPAGFQEGRRCLWASFCTGPGLCFVRILPSALTLQTGKLRSQRRKHPRPM